MIPLYTTMDIERRDAWERVRKTTEPFENELLMTLMHDTFKVADELKHDYNFMALNKNYYFINVLSHTLSFLRQSFRVARLCNTQLVDWLKG